MSEACVWVRYWWNAPRAAKVRRGDLAGPYWDSTARIPRRGHGTLLLHGVMSCGAVLQGEVEHGCAPETAPHLLTVCVMRRDNDPATFAELLAAAGPKPAA